MKYVFMYKHMKEHTIARMAKVLEVSESGYYKWLKRLNAPLTEREKADLELTKEIHEIYWGSYGVFGARKITSILNKRHSRRINHKKVERIMSENCLKSRVTKAYVNTTDSDHDEPIAPNLLKRDFKADAPDQKFVSDTTEKETKQGKIYIAAILDLYGRMPVGMAISRNNDTELVRAALGDMVRRGHGKEVNGKPSMRG